MRLRLNIFIAVILLSPAVCGCVPPLNDEDKKPEEVNVSLALSLQGSAATKMTSSVVQKYGNNFHGIEQVFVIPFNTPVPSGENDARPVIAQDERLGERNVDLHNQGIAENGLVANNNSHLFDDAVIPRMMNRVLVYGKSIDEPVSGATASDKSWKHHNGVLNPINLDNPFRSDDISFSLEQIVSSSDSSTVLQKADQAIAKLNNIVDAILLTGEASFNNIFSLAKGQILACSYQTLSSLRDNVQAAIFGYSGPGITDILNALDEFAEILDGTGGIGNDFPNSFGIPEGVIGIWWNGRDFIRLINSVNIALVPIHGYCYPPCLWYYANSPISTTDNENIKNEYVPANETWNTILGKYDPSGTGNNKAVWSSTVSVAVYHALQYGVGRLDLTLGGCSATEALGCPLTGIIVGDQKDVGFDFSPMTSASRYVYDNIVDGPVLESGASASTATTLLLQSVSGQKVHFALEFQNNTRSTLSGQQGDIMPNSRFYLAGVLEPPTGTSVFTQDYITSVTVRIESLDNAYNVLPDLHDPQLEIGIVADMKWVQVTPLSVKLNL